MKSMRKHFTLAVRRRMTLIGLAAALMALPASAQNAATYNISTFAGSGPIGQDEGRTRGDGGPALEARLESPGSVFVDSAGNVYVSTYRSTRKIDTQGIIQPVYAPSFPMTHRGNGNILFYSRYEIGEITPDGTSLGTAIKLPNSSVNAPGIAVTPAGDLYLGLSLLEAGDDRYRTITSYMLQSVYGLASNAAGRVFIYGREGMARIEPDRTVTMLTRPYCALSTNCYNVPQEQQFRSIDGTAATATVGQIHSVVFDASGNAYFTESIRASGTSSCKVRVMAPDRSIRTIAGGESCEYKGENGPADQARFMSPWGIGIDGAGNLYVADSGAHRIRKLSPARTPGSSFRVAGVAHAASYQQNELAPGAVFTLFGEGLGPSAVAGLRMADGKVATSVAGVRILFDGIPAPLLYVSAGQSSGIVPYRLTGGQTKIEVEVNGSRTSAVTVPLAQSSPGIFTADSSGKGSAVALNQDGKLNSKENAAGAGSIVVLYATGFGAMTESPADGAINGTDLLRPKLPVSASIGGHDAEVLYAGSAPGLVAGMMQLNVRIPHSVGGTPEVRVRVGERISPPGVTLNVGW